MAGPYAVGCCPTPSGPEGSSGKQLVDEPYQVGPELEGFLFAPAKIYLRISMYHAHQQCLF